MKKVDIGCGDQKMTGYIGVDMQAIEGVDYVLDIRSGLPFADEEVDEIRCSHVMEHLTGEEGLKLLKEMYRVISPKGVIELEVPDFIWVLENFIKRSEEDRWDYCAQMIFGLQDKPGEFHKNGFSRERLIKMCEAAGLRVHGIVPIWSHGQRCMLAKATRYAD